MCVLGGGGGGVGWAIQSRIAQPTTPTPPNIYIERYLMSLQTQILEIRAQKSVSVVILCISLYIYVYSYFTFYQLSHCYNVITASE